jgi:thioredoxin-dependent peroxiredoxin
MESRGSLGSPARIQFSWQGRSILIHSAGENMNKVYFAIALCAAVLLLGGVGLLTTNLRARDKMPAVGTEAPNFTLNSQDGQPVSLSEYRGKWVVLYFYPKDMTPGCTIEAHNFQRDLPKYEAKNAVILGVSVQDPKSHQKFCAKDGLHFKLLADTSHEVSEKYDSLNNFGVMKLSARHTFLIDPTGKIRKVWSDVDVHKHSDEVLAALDQLQHTGS